MSNPVIGISLAVLSGLFIGSSFILKKKGLLDSAKTHGEIGAGHSYLKSSVWWTGLILMAIGEGCNFVAYAFAPAILVTPLGALSVVISAVLSSLFLNEKLNFSGKIGCAQCVIGALIIVMNAPSTAVTNTMPDFFGYVVAPGFLIYSAMNIFLILYLIYQLSPRYGNKYPVIYISVCSMVGSFLVVAIQGFGSSIVYSTANWNTDNQFRYWTIYLLLAFIVFAVVSQIHFLNKALNTFSTAIVTPVYYVFFTSCTLLTSAVLFRGFPVGSVVAGVMIIAGFLVIVGGVALLFEYNAQITAAKDLRPPEEKPQIVDSFRRLSIVNNDANGLSLVLNEVSDDSGDEMYPEGDDADDDSDDYESDDYGLFTSASDPENLNLLFRRPSKSHSMATSSMFNFFGTPSSGHRIGSEHVSRQSMSSNPDRNPSLWNTFQNRHEIISKPVEATQETSPDTGNPGDSRNPTYFYLPQYVQPLSTLDDSARLVHSQPPPHPRLLIPQPPLPYNSRQVYSPPPARIMSHLYPMPQVRSVSTNIPASNLSVRYAPNHRIYSAGYAPSSQYPIPQQTPRSQASHHHHHHHHHHNSMQILQEKPDLEVSDRSVSNPGTNLLSSQSLQFRRPQGNEDPQIPRISQYPPYEAP